VFTLRDLFGVQRERVAALLGERAGRAMLDLLAGMRPVLDALQARATAVSPAVAALLGWDGAIAIATALGRGGEVAGDLVERTRALRQHGAVFPAEWLSRRLARALGRAVERLPAGAGDALRLLDVAAAAGVALDLAPAQVTTFTWWRGQAGTPGAIERTLALRLGLAVPEAP
jgi:hypothetical protein